MLAAQMAAIDNATLTFARRLADVEASAASAEAAPILVLLIAPNDEGKRRRRPRRNRAVRNC